MVLALTSLASQNNKLIISTEEQIAQDTAQVPCKDSERLKSVKSQFLRLGAQPEDVLTDKRDGVDNIIVRKQGQAQGIIVIGAHYDKSESGCGAIDNWTGVVALTHIYRSLKDIPFQKTLIFAGFGKEEQGLYGSKAMVRGIKNEEVSQYCAMVNIDSLGMAAPQVVENLSSRPLVDRVTELAQRMKMPFSRVTVPGVGADSIPFIEKKIPAVTISALGNGWSEILHTRNDPVAIVNSKSVYLGYMLALAFIGELDNVACDANWKKSNAK